MYVHVLMYNAGIYVLVCDILRLLTLGVHAQRGLLLLSVCLLVNISRLGHLFVLKTLSHTQQATKVKMFL